MRAAPDLEVMRLLGIYRFLANHIIHLFFLLLLCVDDGWVLLLFCMLQVTERLKSGVLLGLVFEVASAQRRVKLEPCRSNKLQRILFIVDIIFLLSVCIEIDANLEHRLL